MNFSQLQCLVALVETGNFTEAAYTVGMTQSAVSHALADLERELGVPLLLRTRKGVGALTSVGQSILPHVRLLLTQVESIEQETRAARGEASGKLRLGSTPYICPGLLAGLLTAFQASYPEMDVVLFEGTQQEVQEWISMSLIDVGFVLHPASGVESTLVTTDDMQVFVSQRHPLHTHTTVSMTDLRKERLIVPKTGAVLMERVGLAPRKTEPQIRYQASDSATILAMIREDLGITLLPRMMLPEHLEGVVALPLDPPQQLPIGLAVQSQKTASRATRVFIKMASTWIQERVLLFSRTHTH